jgi:hypothetical protein
MLIMFIRHSFATPPLRALALFSFYTGDLFVRLYARTSWLARPASFVCHVSYRQSFCIWPRDERDPI